MNQVLSLIGPFLGLIVVGVVAARVERLATHGRRAIEWTLFNLALPALLLGLAAESAAVSRSSFFLSVAFGTYCAFSIAFTYGALRNRGEIRVATIQGAIGSHSGIAYLGPALVIPAFGAGAGMPLAVIFLIDGVLVRLLLPVLWSIGGRERLPFRMVARGIGASLLQPAFGAVIAGLLLFWMNLEIPVGIDQALDMLGAAAAPLGLLAVGLAIGAYRSQVQGGARLQWTGALAVKLFLHPLIVYLLLSWVGDFEPAWVLTAVFLAALPAVHSVRAIAKTEPSTVGEMDAVGVTGVLVSLVTITALVALAVSGELRPDLFVSD